MFLSGTYDDVQNTLKYAFYRPDVNWHGLALLKIYINDLGKYARTVINIFEIPSRPPNLFSNISRDKFVY